MIAHGSTPRGGRPDPRDPEAGETLIEVVVAVLLMGLVITTILGGIFSLVRISDYNQERTRASVAVQTYAEQIKQPVGDLEYISCGTTAAYQAKFALTGVSSSLPTGYSATISSVGYLQNNGTYSTAASSCPPTTTNPPSTPGDYTRDGGLQQFTITITNSRPAPNNVIDTLVVIKRDARCPQSQLGYSNVNGGPC